MTDWLFRKQIVFVNMCLFDSGRHTWNKITTMRCRRRKSLSWNEMWRKEASRSTAVASRNLSTFVYLTRRLHFILDYTHSSSMKFTTGVLWSLLVASASAFGPKPLVLPSTATAAQQQGSSVWRPPMMAAGGAERAYQEEYYDGTFAQWRQFPEY